MFYAVLVQPNIYKLVPKRFELQAVCHTREKNEASVRVMEARYLLVEEDACPWNSMAAVANATLVRWRWYYPDTVLSAQCSDDNNTAWLWPVMLEGIASIPQRSAKRLAAGVN